MGKQTRQVEMYVAYPYAAGDSGGWYTRYVDIPVSTPKEQIETVARAVLLESLTGDVAFVGVYHIPELEGSVHSLVADSDDMAECPNCGCVFAYTQEDFWVQIADEVDWQEPGNEVPAAKCPDCGVYAYVAQEGAANDSVQ